MFDLSKLETFLLAAENLSFTEAAHQLHVTQPTVSHHIKSLEKALDVKLFQRTGGGLELTEAGRLLIPWARKVLHDSMDLQKMMEALQEGIAGELRIACSTTAGKYILPQLAARFSQLHPGIRVSIMRCTSEHVVPTLIGGEANLGVVSHESRDEVLEMQKFFRDSITLIVSAHHPWASRTSIEPEELISEPLIIREETSGTRRVMLSELARHDISLDDLNIFMQLGNAEAIVRTVAAGYGVSFVSTLATACPLERGNVVDVNIKGVDLERTIYMVRKRLDTAYRPQEVFWSFVHNPENKDILRLADHH